MQILFYFYNFIKSRANKVLATFSLNVNLQKNLKRWSKHFFLLLFLPRLCKSAAKDQSRMFRTLTFFATLSSFDNAHAPMAARRQHLITKSHRNMQKAFALLMHGTQQKLKGFQPVSKLWQNSSCWCLSKLHYILWNACIVIYFVLHA